MLIYNENIKINERNYKMIYTIEAESNDYKVERGFKNKKDAEKVYNRMIKEDFTKITKNWA